MGRRILPFVVVGLLTALSCENERGDVTAPESVARVSILLAVASLERGTSVPVQAQVRGEHGSSLDRAVTWSSSDPAIVTVAPGTTPGTATLTALTTGEATITASTDGLSGSAAVSVTNPRPALLSVNPARVEVGQTSREIELAGTRFVPESAGRWNGSPRPTTFVDATRLIMRLEAADLAAPGGARIDVVSPGPGGGMSAVVDVAIEFPLPAATALSPSSADAGSPAFELIVMGSRFVEGAAVRWDDTAVPTTFVSALELRAQVPAQHVAAGAVAAVTVANPSPGGGASAALPFTVNWAVPSLTGVAPAATLVGGPALTLRVTGTGFGSASVVRLDGAERTTTFVNATTLEAALPASDLAVEGTAQISVFTPEPGGGTSGSLPFRVSALPVIEVNPGSVEFDGTENGPNPAPRSVFIVAAGDGRLTSLTADARYEAGRPAGWLAVSLSSSVSPATLTVTVNAAGLRAGTHRATVRVAAAVAANNPVDIPVELTLVALPPVLSVSPGTVTRLFWQGYGWLYGNPPDTLTVTNTGGGTIAGLAVNIAYINPCSFGWISASLTSTTAPASVILEYNTINMCWSFFPGTHYVDVEITSTTPGVPPAVVPVAATIQPAETPQMTTLPATGITATSAVLRGDLVGQGVYYVGFFITTDTIGGPVEYIIANQGAVHSQTFATAVTGLQSGTRYFYWINASDWGECHCARDGSILSFTTLEPAPAGATAGTSQPPEPASRPTATHAPRNRDRTRPRSPRH